MMTRPFPRKRSIAFKSDVPIARDTQLAAEVVREVLQAGHAHNLRIRALHIEYRVLTIDVDLPAEVGIVRSEDEYLADVGRRLVEAIQSAVHRVGAPGAVIAASPGA